MGAMLQDARVRFEECHTAWLNECEFAELARTLKALAQEQGVATDPIINELVHFGAEAAFALLTVETRIVGDARAAKPTPIAQMKPAGPPLVH
ncbi:hypothetical protein [Novosphingobium decolorationis]|uniref:Uncharacterized protein n=1 Tax=Novosphingobium decolorationis TaxID=2698673 RepID=A0ABX8E7L7_9SPHN|nr:hypothetical protein [Novosphingobium decolorationis]QVM85004.1 hypothetical protein HT578_16045 [Novosphingobium decolorationis]